MVLIFSDVYEGKYRPEDLERIIHRNMLYSPAVTILEINPVTKQNMKKCLDHILQSEFSRKGKGFPLKPGKRSKSSSLPTLDSTWIDEIHTCTGGDLRQVIMTFQFLYSVQDSEKKSESQSLVGNYHRDVTLSTFHALGKLLYAKRRASSDGTMHMDFDPEKVLEASSIGLQGALTFLGYHSPDFFTDISELSQAFDTFSDSAFFMDKVYSVRCFMSVISVDFYFYLLLIFSLDITFNPGSWGFHLSIAICVVVCISCSRRCQSTSCTQ